MQADIQTISWPEIVRRIRAIREDNPITAISSAGNNHAATPATASLDAHDIANRIMRQENYLIALFNKELLDLRVPLPRAFKRILHRADDEGKGRTLTKVLEWNLRFCLMEYLFDPRGRVRKVFLKSKNRAVLIEGYVSPLCGSSLRDDSNICSLRRRFIFVGILNAVFAPFIVLYMIMYSFFRYFDVRSPRELHGKSWLTLLGRNIGITLLQSVVDAIRHSHNGSSANSMSCPIYSLADWMSPTLSPTYTLVNFRTRRLRSSCGKCVIQDVDIIKFCPTRFVAFVAGSYAAVLVLVSVLDPELALHFEVTPHRTVLFYITIFASILGVARGMIPEENRVFDPELLMTEVIQYTHYMPDEWKDQLHSKQVC